MVAQGVSLMLIGAIVIVVEAHVQSLGVLGAPGAAALGIGAMVAVSGLHGGVILGVVMALLLDGVSAAAVMLSVTKGMAVRRMQVSAGPEAMIGHIGTVRSWSEQSGFVTVDGALWQTRRSWCGEDHAELHAGDTIVVERLRRLTLGVREAEEWELI
jgi:membrane-bound ClpP family serine protease